MWKTVKSFLLQKIHYSERRNLTEENDSLLTNCEEVAKELNNFFVNAVKNLNIPNYENYYFFAENINDPNLEAIAKWRNHSSILAIAWEYENTAIFSFNFVPKEKRWMSRRPSRRMTFQLKSLRQMIMSLQKRFVIILTNH